MRHRLPTVAVVIVALAVYGAPPAAADLAQSAVVSEHPVQFTPHVLDGTVWSVAVVGGTVVVGGSFTSVADSSRRHTYARRNIFAFDLHDGTIRSFAPAVDGTVYSLARGPADTVYLGGGFTRVNGANQRGLARLTLSGNRLSSFHASIDRGDVRTVAERAGRVYAGGSFAAVNGVARAGLARLDAASGAVDRDFDARLSWPSGQRNGVENFDISPDGRLLVAIGALRRSGGSDRAQVAMFDISGPTAALTDWYTNAYQPPCGLRFETYVRQVKFSPDGSYMVIVVDWRRVLAGETL